MYKYLLRKYFELIILFNHLDEYLDGSNCKICISKYGINCATCDVSTCLVI